MGCCDSILSKRDTVKRDKYNDYRETIDRRNSTLRRHIIRDDLERKCSSVHVNRNISYSEKDKLSCKTECWKSSERPENVVEVSGNSNENVVRDRRFPIRIFPEDIDEELMSALHEAVWFESADEVKQIVQVRDVNERCGKGRSALHYAASRGDVGIINTLIEAGADLDCHDDGGLTPLHVAAGANRLQATMTLIQNKAQVDPQNESNETPLHLAAKFGSKEIIQILLDAGADMGKIDDKGNTVLHKAATANNFDTAEIIINRTIFSQFRFNLIKRENKQGYTPLQCAAAKGSRLLLKFLLVSGSDVDSFNETALHIAAGNGNVKACEILLEYGAKVDAIYLSNTPLHLASDNGQCEVIEMLIKSGADVNRCCEGRFTPLHVASWNGHAGAVELLVRNDAAVNALTELERTSLSYATLNGTLDIVKLLVRSGARVNFGDFMGFTPLHTAVDNDHYQIAKFLIAKNADVDASNGKKETPLHLAAMRGNLELTKLLHKAGADPFKKDLEGWNSMHFASFKSRLTVCNYLLECNIDLISTVTEFDQIPLHLAAQSGDREITEFLIQKGSDIDKMNKFGNTPLHLAASEGAEDVVKLLLDNKASVNKKTFRGETPLHSAVTSEKSEKLIKLLIDYGADIDAVEKDIGNTALHLAVICDKIETVKCLIQNNSNIDIKNKYEDTALDTAIDLNREEIVKFLKTN